MSGVRTEKLRQLETMGFNRGSAEEALVSCDGNVDRAVELLVENASAPSASRTSVDTNRERAALAALERQQNRFGGVSKLKNKSPKRNDNYERAIQSAAEDVARFPPALDILVYAITTILNNPGVKKYRELKMTNKKFQETVGKSQGSSEKMLGLIGFTQAGDWFVLRGNEDSAKLWIAKEALENQKSRIIYQSACERIEFEKVLKASLASADTEESARRKLIRPKVPRQPSLGIAGTTRLNIFLGDDTVLQRRFNADDTLREVIYWLGAEHSSHIPTYLDSKQWELIDRTLFPHRRVDVLENSHKTLQALGLWPSADISIQPFGFLENDPTK